jgi:hypothetical protein
MDHLSQLNDLPVIYDVLCQSLFNVNDREFEPLLLKPEEIKSIIPLLKLLLASSETQYVFS